ncbi:unnamed protein product [Choristocarpus tenellus]
MEALEIAGVGLLAAEHVVGKRNDLTDGISRWERDGIQPNLQHACPCVDWQEQSLGQGGVMMCLSAVQSCRPEDQFFLLLRGWKWMERSHTKK